MYGLYALERYGYGPEQVGIILMVMGLMYALAQGILVGPLTKRFSENKIIVAALAGNAVGFIAILLASSFIGLLLTISFFMLFNSILKPTAISFVSKNTTMRQGATMGLVESYMSLGRVLGPLWSGFIFDVNINYPFISGGLIFLLFFILQTISKVKRKKGYLC
ncbi:MFS transporter [Fuchsiella alkaliacetigena]|nr:MFS transporter [Fuchsiella alkaliacetigena]